jgi:hypothetical protein
LLLSALQLISKGVYHRFMIGTIIGLNYMLFFRTTVDFSSLFIGVIIDVCVG